MVLLWGKLVRRKCGWFKVFKFSVCKMFPKENSMPGIGRKLFFVMNQSKIFQYRITLKVLFLTAWWIAWIRAEEKNNSSWKNLVYQKRLIPIPNLQTTYLPSHQLCIIVCVFPSPLLPKPKKTQWSIHKLSYFEKKLFHVLSRFELSLPFVVSPIKPPMKAGHPNNLWNHSVGKTKHEKWPFRKNFSNSISFFWVPPCLIQNLQHTGGQKSGEKISIYALHSLYCYIARCFSVHSASALLLAFQWPTTPHASSLYDLT